jgi:hypothetical protein
MSTDVSEKHVASIFSRARNQREYELKISRTREEEAAFCSNANDIPL